MANRYVKALWIPNAPAKDNRWATPHNGVLHIKPLMWSST
jgi:hypothetical protein